MNAILQCISNTEELAKYLVTDSFVPDLKAAARSRKKSKSGTKGNLTYQIANIVKSIWLGQYDCRISWYFIHTVMKYGDQYRGYMQHDGQEFLMWLLDNMHEDLKIHYRSKKGLLFKKQQVPPPGLLGGQQSPKMTETIIKRLFHGCFFSSLVCRNCKKTSGTLEPYMCLSLPIPQRQHRALFVTVVKYEEESSYIRKIGLTIPILCQMSIIREEIANRESALYENIILFDVNFDSFSGVMKDSDLMSDITYRGDLYAFIIPSTDNKNNNNNNNNNNSNDNSSSSSSNSSSSNITPKAATIVISPCNNTSTHISITPANITNTPINTTTISNNTTTTPNNTTTISNNTTTTPNNTTTTPNNTTTTTTTTPNTTTTTTTEESFINTPNNNENGDIAISSNSEMVNLICVNVHDLGYRPRRFTLPFIMRVPIDARYEVIRGMLVKRLGRNIREENSSLITALERVFKIKLVDGIAGRTYIPLTESKPFIGQSITIPFDKISTPAGKVLRVYFEWESDVKTRLFGRWQEHGVDECESVNRTHIAFRAPHKAVLYDCLSLLTQAEELLADEWFCSKCKEKQPGVKKLDLYEAPNILVMHLKRFRQNGLWRQKLDNLVEYPLNGLDLSPFIINHSIADNFLSLRSYSEPTLVMENLNTNNDNKSNKKMSKYRKSKKPSASAIPETKINEDITHVRSGSDIPISPHFKSAVPIVQDSPILEHSTRACSTTSNSSCATDLDHLSTTNPYIYDLYAVGNHHGGMSSGHYTACCKNPLNGKWYHFDDKIFVEIDDKKVINQSAYLLFYARRQLHTDSTSCTTSPILSTESDSTDQQSNNNNNNNNNTNNNNNNTNTNNNNNLNNNNNNNSSNSNSNNSNSNNAAYAQLLPFINEKHWINKFDIKHPQGMEVMKINTNKVLSTPTRQAYSPISKKFTNESMRNNDDNNNCNKNNFGVNPFAPQSQKTNTISTLDTTVSIAKFNGPKLPQASSHSNLQNYSVSYTMGVSNYSPTSSRSTYSLSPPVPIHQTTSVPIISQSQSKIFAPINNNNNKIVTSLTKYHDDGNISETCV